MDFNTVRKLIYSVSILVVAAIWLLPAPAGAVETFPASIKVSCSPEIIDQIVRHDYPIDLIEDTSVFLYVTEKEYHKLMNQFEKEFKNGAAVVTIIQTRAEVKEIVGRKDAVYALNYHTYDTMVRELEQLQSQHADIVKIIELGTVSDNRRKMWAVKISDNVAIEEDEPLTLLNGGIHGNEMPGPELTLYVINHLLSNRGTSSIDKLIKETQLWFIPMINPYGHESGTRTNARGVDLNRDFPTSWRTQSDNGDCEAETRILISFFKEHPNIMTGIDYHTYGSMYMRPWAHTRQNPADHSALNDLCVKMGAAAGYKSGSISSLMGAINGGSVDYYYGAFGDFHYGVELGTSHAPLTDKLEALCSQNLDSALLLLNRVHQSVVTGHITSNGAPVVAEVMVDGIDASDDIRLPSNSDATFGRYYRMLMPGTYTVTFVHNGEKVVKSGVSITANHATVVDVEFSGDSNPDPDPDADPDQDTGGCDGGSSGSSSGGGCGS